MGWGETGSPPLGAGAQGSEGGRSLWSAEKWLRLRSGAELAPRSCPSAQLPQKLGSSSRSALLSMPFCLSLFLSLRPSTCYISLAHLSSSISGWLAPSLSLSTSPSLCLPLTLSRSRSSWSPLLLQKHWGVTCSWPGRHHLGPAGSQGLCSERLLLPALHTRLTYLTTDYGHHSTCIQPGGGGLHSTGAGT